MPISVLNEDKVQSSNARMSIVCQDDR